MFHKLCKLLRRCLDRPDAAIPKSSQTAERRMPHFFDNYAPYRPLLDSGQFRYCIESALLLLGGVRQLAPQQYQAAHKGSPFYVMGYAAFASHDYPTASLFFDAALAEDLQNYPGRLDSPAMLFMQLSDNMPDGTPVLGTEIVTQIKADIDILIADYNARTGARQVTLDELRTFFLGPIITSGQPHTRTLVTALISFIAEWRYRARLINLFEHGSREPFFLHLFRGCLLFESLLKGQTKKVPTHNTLGDILRLDLLAELGLANVQVGANNFNNDVVAGLGPNMSIEATINSTGKARNTLGHNLVWMVADLNAGTYDLLMKNIASACLHAISELYRP
jgi:hypothetical protein